MVSPALGQFSVSNPERTQDESADDKCCDYITIVLDVRRLIFSSINAAGAGPCAAGRQAEISDHGGPP
jgi:hypothetical protein